MTDAVYSKAEYYRRWHRGDFGNRPRNWPTLEDLNQDTYAGLVTIRYKTPGSNFCRSGILRSEVESVVAEMIEAGATPELLTFNETPPDSKVLFQGEVMLTEHSLYLLYSLAPNLSCKHALQQSPEHARGLVARGLLKHYMNAQDLSDLDELLEVFPDSVVEFSTYSVNVGCCPGRRTLFWEVRNY